MADRAWGLALVEDAFEELLEVGGGSAGGEWVGGFGDGSERAEDGVEFVGFDQGGRVVFFLFFEGVGGFTEAGFFGEVGGGVAAAAEEEFGALHVELVGGDAAGEFGDGELDGGTVFERRQDEGGVRVDEGLLGGVARGEGVARDVVGVAEVCWRSEGRTEGEGAAAVAFGEDVAALVTASAGVGSFGCGCGLRIGGVHFFSKKAKLLERCWFGWGYPPG
jgi:hypothetical protein